METCLSCASLGTPRRLQWADLISHIAAGILTRWQAHTLVMPNNKTLDEFAVPKEAQDMLMQYRPYIEHLFRVEMNVLGELGLDPEGSRKIWLQLQGCRGNLHRAKEYIKGLCTPELKEEIHYPKDMQCIFIGVHGLFRDCLVQGTSANLTLLHPGTLSISGLAEAFVMAQSRIQEFVGKHQKNPKLPEEREAQVKRAFRELVETHNDKHAMDLLILPSSVKEELLSLVKEVQEEVMGQEQRNGGCTSPGFGQESSLGWESQTVSSGRPQSPNRPQPFFGVPAVLGQIRGQSRTRDVSPELPAGSTRPQGSPHEDLVRPSYSVRPRDVKMDLPTAGGKSQDQTWFHVPRAEFSRGSAEAKLGTRPQEHLSDMNGPLDGPEAMVNKTPVPKSVPQPIPATSKVQHLLGFAVPTESLKDRGKEGKSNLWERKSSSTGSPEETSEEDPASNILLSSWTEKEFKMRLNFFKTMGYEERVVKKILLEGGVREAPSTILDRVQMMEAQKGDPLPFSEKHEERGFPLEEPQDEEDYLRELIKTAMANCGHSPSKIPTEIQTGAPLADLLRQLNEKAEHQEEDVVGVSATKPEYEGLCDIQRGAILNHGEGSPKRTHPEARWNGRTSSQQDVHVSRGNPGPPAFTPGASSADFLFSISDSERSPSSESTSLEALHQGSVSTVTGAQRFEEALQMEFKLKLANTPGKKDLRMIIIDGSNVAMMHGLNQFFSCRGIALAVQYFWDRGHREVNVLLPAYRMEEDSNVREQHYLMELHHLRILSLTPSRKIDGKGIVPYDDRMMLKLAEQTNGIIVTNDQFRDLARESKRWIKIIKESLLQYTFVGNIFMVPDDPLGRNGPTLAEFLKKNTRIKGPNCHSFGGQATPVFTSARPTSQTEVLQLRDRKPPPGKYGEQRISWRDNLVEQEKFRSEEDTERLRNNLLEIFEGQDRKVDFVLIREPYCLDLNKLSEAILSLSF